MSALVCRDCPAPIKGMGKTGRCPKCVSRATITAFNQSAKSRQASSKRSKAGRLWEYAAIKAHAPEARAKAGLAISRTRLAWCPPELHHAYRVLCRVKKMKAEDAKAMILAEHESKMAAARRRMTGEVEAANARAFERDRIQSEFARQAR